MSKNTGATIYVSWEEFIAIQEALNEMTSKCEGANIDYVKSIEKTCIHIANFSHKFKKAKRKNNFKKLTSDQIKIKQN